MRNSIAAIAAAGVLLGAAAAMAQDRTPSADWNANWGFPSAAQSNLRLLQAELIEKKQRDFYSEFGRTTVHSTTVVHGDLNHDASQTIHNHLPDGYQGTIDQSTKTTTAVGAINNTTIDISNSSNIDISSSAGSQGCQDASINIAAGTAGDGLTGGVSAGGGASSC